MTQSRIHVAALVVLLLAGAVAPVAATQGVRHGVFLDKRSEKVANITVGGQTYQVYRYENVVPYASGIDIYADGERVTDESRARTVLAALARRRAAKRLGPADVRALRRSRRNVTRVTADVENATNVLHNTTTYLSRMQMVRANGTTVYNASVEAAPKVTKFNDSARETATNLRSFENDSADYVANATRLKNVLRRRQNGSAVDPQKLYTLYASTLAAREDLSDHLGYGGVSGQLETMATMSAAVSDNVTSVPKRGEELSSRFERVHNESVEAANRTDSLELPGYSFGEPQGRAESLQSDWMDAWRSRRNAATTVYETLVGLGVALALVVGYVYRKRG